MKHGRVPDILNVAASGLGILLVAVDRCLFCRAPMQYFNQSLVVLMFLCGGTRAFELLLLPSCCVLSLLMDFLQDSVVCLVTL